MLQNLNEFALLWIEFNEIVSGILRVTGVLNFQLNIIIVVSHLKSTHAQKLICMYRHLFVRLIVCSFGLIGRPNPRFIHRLVSMKF